MFRLTIKVDANVCCAEPTVALRLHGHALLVMELHADATLKYVIAVNGSVVNILLRTHIHNNDNFLVFLFSTVHEYVD